MRYVLIWMHQNNGQKALQILAKKTIYNYVNIMNYVTHTLTLKKYVDK